MTRRGVTYEALAERLTEIGVADTAVNLRTKSRAAYSAVFLVNALLRWAYTFFGSKTLMHNSVPVRQRAYSNRLAKVAYSRRSGWFRLISGRLATSRTSFLCVGRRCGTRDRRLHPDDREKWWR